MSALPPLIDFKGLVTTPGLLMREPASCVTADNVIFPAPGLMQKRPGFSRQPGTAGSSIYQLATSRLMGSNVLVHQGGAATGGTDLRYGDGSVALTALTTVDTSSVTRPFGTKLQMGVSLRNHYLTSDEGMRRLESDIGSSAVRFAGMPRGQGLRCFNMGGAPNVLAGGVGTLLPDGYARAYRVTWHRKDADGVELGGAPTGRTVIRNQAGSSGYAAATVKNTLPNIPIPREFGTTATALTTSYFWRLWGTRTFNAAGGDPGDDEMYLVAEAYLTAGDLALGYVPTLDETPDSFLFGSPPLHTNGKNFPPSEVGIRQGVVNADDPPPTATNVVSWRDVMWAWDITYRPRTQFVLLGTGGASGLQNNDTVTVTVNGVNTTVTAKNAPAGALEFKVETALATTAMNVEATARNLCECINLNCVGARAYHVSSGNDFPGVIFVEWAQHLDGATQTAVGSSRGGAFRPNLSGGIAGSNDAATNAGVFSKSQRADAWPPVNGLNAGPRDARVIRAFPYRDRLLLFTDYGIFQVTGDDAQNFAVSEYDLTYKLLGRECVAACDDKVYAWCAEGIIECDDAGARVISTPIEPTIAAAVAASGLSTFAKLAFTTAYRIKHRVMFFYPETSDEAALRGCALWLVYDTRTRAWSTGSYTKDIATYKENRSCAVTRLSDDLLVLGNWNELSSDAYLFLERNSGTAADYNDTAASGTDYPVTLSAEMQFLVPEKSGWQHWQQTTLHFDGGEFAGRPLPTTAVTLSWQGDTATNSYTFTPNGTERYRREEPSRAVRRSSRLKIAVVHSVAAYLGIIGISQCVGDPSRFAKGP